MSDQKRYQLELQEQMEEQRRRKEAEQQEEKLDWWEKREPKVDTARPKTKQHPSQVLYKSSIFLHMANTCFCSELKESRCSWRELELKGSEGIFWTSNSWVITQFVRFFVKNTKTVAGLLFPSLQIRDRSSIHVLNISQFHKNYIEDCV